MPGMPTTLSDQETYTPAGRKGAKSTNYPTHEAKGSGDMSRALTDQTKHNSKKKSTNVASGRGIEPHSMSTKNPGHTTLHSMNAGRVPTRMARPGLDRVY